MTLSGQPPQQPLGSGLDIESLIEASRPRNAVRRLGLLVPIAWMLVFFATASQRSGGQQFALATLAIGVTLGVSLVLRAAARSSAAEQQTLSQLEDRLALKQPAAVLSGVATLLSSPVRTAEARLRGLILLATALARLDRSDEAIHLYDQLLDGEKVAGAGATIVRAARAMALLRTDRLFDADRAISDLRQRLKRPPAPRPQPSAEALLDPDADATADLSADAPIDLDEITDAVDRDTPHLYAAVRLVELYRDVKTGHPNDAIQLFTTDREALRTGLAHRYAEALALVAAAHDRLGHTDDAAKAFADATALAPASDLLRKYPELTSLPTKYPTTPPPPRR